MSANIKYAVAGLLVASVFALVLAGKIDANEYTALVGTLLAGLGVHGITSGNKAPTLPPTDQPGEKS